MHNAASSLRWAYCSVLSSGLLQVKRLAGATEANRKRAVIWASPPCTEYSMLKGGRPRDLEGADACVAAVGRIARDLDAAVVRQQRQQQQQARRVPGHIYVSLCSIACLPHHLRIPWLWTGPLWCAGANTACCVQAVHWA
jgi:hypothetical protein